MGLLLQICCFSFYSFSIKRGSRKKFKTSSELLFSVLCGLLCCYVLARVVYAVSL